MERREFGQTFTPDDLSPSEQELRDKEDLKKEVMSEKNPGTRKSGEIRSAMRADINRFGGGEDGKLLRKSSQKPGLDKQENERPDHIMNEAHKGQYPSDFERE